LVREGPGTISIPSEAVSQRLADVLARTTYADLPSPVVTETKRAILDWLGSALAGAVEPAARLMQRVVAGLGTSQESTVFAAGRSSAAGAAMANGVASHILELDDVHKGSTLHPAAPIIPAALGMAEREHVSGRTLILSIALGYDAALRIGEAVNPSHYRFWHPTGTAGTFGAAVGAGTIMQFTAAQMLDALGNAGTQAAGLWEFNSDGAMSKHLHPGKAAFNGILSADLARAGFTGAKRILEGERGFLRAMSSSFDVTRITDGLGKAWKITENCYKLHACCGHTHSAIDIALDVRSQRKWSAEDVAANVSDIHIETYGPGFEIVKELNPRSATQAKFSTAYCVAVALLEGRVGLEQFSVERFARNGVCDPRIAAMLRRTRVTVEEELTQRYPSAWPARLTLTLGDGSQLSGSSDYPRGNPEHPLTTSQLEDKFLALVGSRFGSDTANSALRTVHAVENCPDVGMLFRNLLPGDAEVHRQS
jgi:2-methylcitrate dehydratase PrpD